MTGSRTAARSDEAARNRNVSNVLVLLGLGEVDKSPTGRHT